ncbi:cytochrome P450 [Paraburkholderia humisilvae]|uniref:Biotin biosynthesis cytochrome P450 n=1 Tax=Paraburkholderia humisilvae TaxID=627669 RepID=A0A6J5ETJ8_9BURK|nr:cytochrome P450 [Paraburkholderia humisilvae]CAB3769274.1 Biotin biosynthesis cytochrome P450 [Paraburkholderia humisilvae]
MQYSDFSTAEFYENPYRLYDEMRRAGPLVKLSPGLFVTGRYAVADRLVTDPRFGKGVEASVRARYGDSAIDQPVFRFAYQMLLSLNPPKHTRLRSLLMKSFNARQIERFRQVSQDISNRLADAVEQKGQADLVRDFTFPLPIQIICTILEIPLEDGKLFRQAADDLTKVLDVGKMNPEQLEQGNRSALELERYFSALLEKRRRNTGDDLLSQMIAAEEAGQHLTDEEIVANLILLFVAGHETTTNMIGNSLISLHRFPDQLRLAIANPDRLPNVVKECMRYETSVQSFMRVALEDTQAEGTSISRGDVVFVWAGAANRDPEMFDDPDTLKVDRSFKDIKTLSFGGGPHFCLGARLATMQIEAALSTLFTRMPDMRIANLNDLHWHQRAQLRGVESLIVDRS